MLSNKTGRFNEEGTKKKKCQKRINNDTNEIKTR